MKGKLAERRVAAGSGDALSAAGVGPDQRELVNKEQKRRLIASNGLEQEEKVIRKTASK